MAFVTIDGEKREYGTDVRFLDIAREYQERYEDDILLVSVDGKLKELHKTVKEDCELKFITAREKPGMQTYQRSAVFLMLKAFYDVVGREKIEKLTVDFTVSNGFFVDARGDFLLSEELLCAVKARMRELADEAIPIMKRSINTDDAVELFHQYRMYDKERLFQYRRASRVNIYSIGNFEDYYYGYMVQNTGYIKYFDLKLYEDGFVLVLPRRSDPKKLEEFKPLPKLYRALRDSSVWGEQLGVSNVGNLNDLIARGEMNKLILMQEALQEKQIGDIAEQIAASAGKKFIMIAGPSSSGKTTFSHRLSIQLTAAGLKPHPIAVDDYFVNRADSPRDEYGNYDYEALECIDVEQFNRDMTALLAGERVELPRYNFITGEREYRGDFLKLGEEDILVIEGIHCLNDKLSYSLPGESKFKIYISALTQLNVDEHNRIPTTDGRLLRRIIRDARTRGNSARETIARWESVRRGEDKNIFPFQEEADVMFNSALVYELAVLKQYAEPLLFGIPKDVPEYAEAKRLLKFLDYFLGVSSENIPHNSMIREFVGGSCFKV
ncbi:MAG TPA: nucleoside kinase [Candidatus Ventrisoma faecale]|nr:nucleoside kinase [Candidatus Ventrisoma faecale]